MSGSGSSLFSLFDGETEAAEAASIVTQRLSVKSVAVEVAPTLTDDLNVCRREL
jgi:4-diphosphocytidyl-2C-methyl-D-erythritol kinase